MILSSVHSNCRLHLIEESHPCTSLFGSRCKRLPHNIAPRTVFFKIGSDKLSPQEEMNLSYLASKIKESPNATYTINGYADSATGTPAFNQKLSLERAQVVKDLLVKKYGISADRLKVAAGGGVDKFGQPILNRVVLVESAQ